MEVLLERSGTMILIRLLETVVEYRRMLSQTLNKYAERFIILRLLILIPFLAHE